MRKKIHDCGLDHTDRCLLKLLQEDGSLSSASLGDQLSMTVTPAWRRRKRLEELGVIKGYQAILDRKKLGFDVLAFAQVRFGNHSEQAPDNFEKNIMALPEILSCHKVSGEADYVLVVLAEDLESYGEFVESVLRKQLGILSIQSSLALREVKFSSKIPLHE